jgi:hypothetical protein
MRNKLVIGLIIGVLVGALLTSGVVVLAGNPLSPGTPPGETGSFTLADIYHSLNNGTAAVAGTFTEPEDGPGTGTMYTLDEIYALTRQRSMVPKTGQTASYAAGDDGDYEKGVSWPDPRFTDNENGTVTDNLTGLIWLTNANCFGTRAWSAALDDANHLNSGECGLTDGSLEGDWRLPNTLEMLSVVDFAVFAPAVSNTDGSGKWTPGDPFTNVQSSAYWTSTTMAGGDTYAFCVPLGDGTLRGYLKSSLYYVWPVRGGQ